MTDRVRNAFRLPLWAQSPLRGAPEADLNGLPWVNVSLASRRFTQREAPVGDWRKEEREWRFYSPARSPGLTGSLGHSLCPYSGHLPPGQLQLWEVTAPRCCTPFVALLHPTVGAAHPGLIYPLWRGQSRGDQVLSPVAPFCSLLLTLRASSECAWNK